MVSALFQRMSNVSAALKISLDELRMQMLGAQVAFGFQFQSLFQDRFDVSDDSIRLAALTGLSLSVLTVGLLVAAPAAHRIADRGQADEDGRSRIAKLARVALWSMAVVLAATVFVPVTVQFNKVAGALAAVLAGLGGSFAWHGWGRLLRTQRAPPASVGGTSKMATSLHDKIDYVLTEARVMLPGAQALLGFQLLVPLMKSFETLPETTRMVHFFALMLVTAVVVLLITPAAIHRIAFGGEDDERFLRLASHIVTIALIPFALGVSSELYVATVRLMPTSSSASWVALGAAGTLFSLWYLWPLTLRTEPAGRR
jgi:hypothetical protein